MSVNYLAGQLRPVWPGMMELCPLARQLRLVRRRRRHGALPWQLRSAGGRGALSVELGRVWRRRHDRARLLTVQLRAIGHGRVIPARIRGQVGGAGVAPRVVGSPGSTRRRMQRWRRSGPVVTGQLWLAAVRFGDTVRVTNLVVRHVVGHGLLLHCLALLRRPDEEDEGSYEGEPADAPDNGSSDDAGSWAV